MVSFNAASTFFHTSIDNTWGIYLSTLMIFASTFTTAYDSFKDRPENKSYAINSIYQAALATMTLSKYVESPSIEEAMGASMHTFAAIGHWFRGIEENKAKEKNETLDVYYERTPQKFSTYSQFYYSLTEFFAVNAGGAFNPAATGITSLAMIRALKDKEFWGLNNALKPLRQVTAPRLLTAAFVVSTAAAFVTRELLVCRLSSCVGLG